MDSIIYNTFVNHGVISTKLGGIMFQVIPQGKI